MYEGMLAFALHHCLKGIRRCKGMLDQIMMLRNIIWSPFSWRFVWRTIFARTISSTKMCTTWFMMGTIYSNKIICVVIQPADLLSYIIIHHSGVHIFCLKSQNILKFFFFFSYSDLGLCLEERSKIFP